MASGADQNEDILTENTCLSEACLEQADHQRTSLPATSCCSAQLPARPGSLQRGSSDAAINELNISYSTLSGILSSLLQTAQLQPLTSDMLQAATDNPHAACASLDLGFGTSAIYSAHEQALEQYEKKSFELPTSHHKANLTAGKTPGRQRVLRVCPACEDADTPVPAKDRQLTLHCKACCRAFHCSCVRVSTAASSVLRGKWTCVECRLSKSEQPAKPVTIEAMLSRSPSSSAPPTPLHIPDPDPFTFSPLSPPASPLLSPHNTRCTLLDLLQSWPCHSHPQAPLSEPPTCSILLPPPQPLTLNSPSSCTTSPSITIPCTAPPTFCSPTAWLPWQHTSAQPCEQTLLAHTLSALQHTDSTTTASTPTSNAAHSSAMAALSYTREDHTYNQNAPCSSVSPQLSPIAALHLPAFTPHLASPFAHHLPPPSALPAPSRTPPAPHSATTTPCALPISSTMPAPVPSLTTSLTTPPPTSTPTPPTTAPQPPANPPAFKFVPLHSPSHSTPSLFHTPVGQTIPPADTPSTGSTSCRRVRWSAELCHVQLIPHKSRSRHYWFAEHAVPANNDQAQQPHRTPNSHPPSKQRRPLVRKAKSNLSHCNASSPAPSPPKHSPLPTTETTKASPKRAAPSDHPSSPPPAKAPATAATRPHPTSPAAPTSPTSQQHPPSPPLTTASLPSSPTLSSIMPTPTPHPPPPRTSDSTTATPHTPPSPTESPTPAPSLPHTLHMLLPPPDLDHDSCSTAPSDLSTDTTCSFDTTADNDVAASPVRSCPPTRTQHLHTGHPDDGSVASMVCPAISLATTQPPNTNPAADTPHPTKRRRLEFDSYDPTTGSASSAHDPTTLPHTAGHPPPSTTADASPTAPCPPVDKLDPPPEPPSSLRSPSKRPLPHLLVMPTSLPKSKLAPLALHAAAASPQRHSPQATLATLPDAAFAAGLFSSPRADPASVGSGSMFGSPLAQRPVVHSPLLKAS